MKDRTARGTALVNLVALQPDEHIEAIIDTRTYEDGAYLFFATRRGMVKKTRMSEYDTSLRAGMGVSSQGSCASAGARQSYDPFSRQSFCHSAAAPCVSGRRPGTAVTCVNPGSRGVQVRLSRKPFLAEPTEEEKEAMRGYAKTVLAIFYEDMAQAHDTFGIVRS